MTDDKSDRQGNTRPQQKFHFSILVGDGISGKFTELAGPDSARTYVNPKIDWASTETVRHQEGSVSMPGVTEEIERPARVRVIYRTLDGETRTEEADGLLALCHQHEIDQLDGIFWLQRLSRLKRERAVKRYEKLKRGS